MIEDEDCCNRLNSIANLAAVYYVLHATVRAYVIGPRLNLQPFANFFRRHMHSFQVDLTHIWLFT